MSDYFDYLFKFLIIGNTSTGKSSLLVRFTDNKFDENKQHTIGVEFASKILNISGKTVKLQIWDTAGQERFRSVTRSYYRGAVGALLVYDIASRASFSAVAKWLSDARSLADPAVAILLVGNKRDLESERQVSTAEARQFAEEHGLLTHVETSAKLDFDGCSSHGDAGTAVNDAFSELARAVLNSVLSGALDSSAVTTPTSANSVTPTTAGSSGGATGYRGKSLTNELRTATTDCQRQC